MSSRSLIQATISALYDDWSEALKTIHEVSAPAALKMWKEELQDLWKQAERLNKLDGIHPHHRTYLKLILQRSPDQWWIYAKSRGKPIPGRERYTPDIK